MELRTAAVEDLDDLVETMFAEPATELRAFMPTLSGARAFTRAIWLASGLDGFVVAEEGGRVAGFGWCSENGASLRQGARAARTAWGPLGPLRLVVKGWPRQLVEIPMPAGPKLLELQVHPSRRGRGVGSAILDRLLLTVGDRPISLTTRTDNPARRLYERHGFTVVATKEHQSFERRTGSSGRVLMVRPGGPSPHE